VRSSGCSSSSTAAKNASKSTCATITVDEKSHIRRRRDTHSSHLPRYGRSMTTKAATPWGSATLVDQVEVPQRAGEKRFSSIVQLLENGKGERFVRFAYTTGGSARRGPVTLRARDLERLRAGLAKHPELAAELDLGGGA
jgi:hypothetical protein